MFVDHIVNRKPGYDKKLSHFLHVNDSCFELLKNDGVKSTSESLDRGSKLHPTPTSLRMPLLPPFAREKIHSTTA